MRVMEETEYPEMVKENVVAREPLSARWLALLAALTGAALLLAARLDAALPAARPPTALDSFSGLAAHHHLRNLTAIGPRVAGSYENEVWAVRTLVEALRRVAAGASAHNRVELDRFEGAGAFKLTFFDGMNNVYRGVQGVLARVSGAGGRSPAAQPALLLNCHFDTVPDSPGASDDGAGCAVMLELARALAATPRPLRRPVVFLFNGAEENIMQGSHSFVTTHAWARHVRAFVNLEACGSGGREVLFQAGPHDPWLMETYARAVPHPFASSLAQELFESGWLPGDTDFRVFRDFGKLSGLDFAWSSNGYVYHTELDTAERVPPAALQRTGDNVLALIRGLLDSPELESAVDRSARQPVFFDVLGAVTVVARAPAALAAALGAAALAALNVHAHASQARRQLYISRGTWWRGALRSAGASAAGALGGALAAAGLGLLLAACDAGLAFYSREWLLAPLAALPAITVSCAVTRWGTRAAWAGARGWARARLVRDGHALLGAAALLASAAARLRSGYLPLGSVLLAALADRAALLAPADKRGDGARAALWALGAALPALQAWYLLLALLATVAPMVGRAGTPPLPADVLVMSVTAVLSMWAASWLQPFVVATRRPGKLMWLSLAVSALALLLVLAGPLYAPYSAARPQRLLVLHARRTLHAPLHAPPAAPVHEDLFWVPQLDANTGRTLKEMANKIGTTVHAGGESECARWVYCGAPYYLPVLGFVSRGYWLPAPSPAPAPAPLAVALRLAEHNSSYAQLHIDLTGPNHAVVIVSPTRHARAAWLAAAGAGALAPLRALPWAPHGRRTHFVALHAARPDHPATWNLTLTLVRDGDAEPAEAADGARWASLSVTGHALAAGRAARPAALAALARAAPPHAALSGWGCHTHLYVV